MQKKEKTKTAATILYMTAIEDAVNKAVIRSQVFKLLARFDKISEIKFLFLAFIPFRFYFDLNDPIRTFFSYMKKRKEIKEEYKSNKVNIVFFPFFFPFRRKYFHMKAFHLYVFLAQTIPLLLFFLLKNNIVFIHARSYPACLISFLCGRLLSIKYLFDMRGFFPDEGVIYGAYTQDSTSYHRWKKIEKNLIKNAHCVFIESQPFKEYVENIYPHTNIVLIPCYVDEDTYRFNIQLREQLRREYSLSDKFVITYSGTIGGWHDPSYQSDFYLEIKKRVPNTHFLILTFKQKNDLIHSILSAKGFIPTDYSLLNPQSNEVPNYLLMGDAGLLVIADLPITKKFVSVKLGEYLACGLPVICTPFVEGASRLIKDNDCGIILDLDNENSLDQIDRLVKNYDRMQLNGFKLVNRHLSVKINAPKFIEIYRAATNNIN